MATRFLLTRPQHHFRNFHRFSVRHAQSVDKNRLLAGFCHPFADGLAAAVYDDRLKTYQL